MLLNLPREGLHLGVVASWLKSTALNPALTSLILSAGLGILRQDHLDSTLAASLMTAVWLLIYLTIFGAVITLNDKLTVGSLNNWVKDTDWDWASEIVVVTGGSSGIGASIVQEFLKRHINAKIVIIDYNKPSASISSDERVKFYQADLSDSLAIKQLAANIKADVGNPTVLVNNAGLTRGKSIMDGSYGDVNMTFSTNIIAPFLLTKEFLPGMVAQNHGHIFAIASMSAIISPAGLADYAATKAGLLAMQEVWLRMDQPLLSTMTNVESKGLKAGVTLHAPSAKSACIFSSTEFRQDPDVQRGDEPEPLFLSAHPCRHSWICYCRRTGQW